MRIFILIVLAGILSFKAEAQEIDTVVIKSSYLKSERTVYIRKPEYYKYQSDKVKLPVIYLLDAQHEWFVQPALNTIKYLQYTHEIPQAIIVEIPLENRMEECAIKSVLGPNYPCAILLSKNYLSQIKAINEYQSIGFLFHEISRHRISPNLMQRFWTQLYAAMQKLAKLIDKHVDELLESILQNSSFFKEWRQISIALGAETWVNY
jgi:Putative esterase